MILTVPLGDLCTLQIIINQLQIPTFCFCSEQNFFFNHVRLSDMAGFDSLTTWWNLMALVWEAAVSPFSSSKPFRGLLPNKLFFIVLNLLLNCFNKL